MHKIVYVKTQSGKQYMYLGDKESLKIGDIVSNDKHDNMEVINVFDSESDTYNGHPIKQLISKKNMQQNIRWTEKKLCSSLRDLMKKSAQSKSGR